MYVYTIQVSLAQANELAALEDEALQFLLQEERKEKEELKQALRVAKNRGKKFHEVSSIAVYMYMYMYMVI